MFEWFTDFWSVLPTSQVVYCAGKAVRKCSLLLLWHKYEWSFSGRIMNWSLFCDQVVDSYKSRQNKEMLTREIKAEIHLLINERNGRVPNQKFLLLYLKGQLYLWNSFSLWGLYSKKLDKVIRSALRQKQQNRKKTTSSRVHLFTRGTLFSLNTIFFSYRLWLNKSSHRVLVKFYRKYYIH